MLTYIWVIPASFGQNPKVLHSNKVSN